jgi:hypothetical protein
LFHGVYILIGFYSLDDGLKNSSYLPETLLDPKFGHAFGSDQTANNIAFNHEGDYWSWLESPSNKFRLTRFGSAMNGAKNLTSAGTVLNGSITMRCVTLQAPF